MVTKVVRRFWNKKNTAFAVFLSMGYQFSSCFALKNAHSSILQYRLLSASQFLMCSLKNLQFSFGGFVSIFSRFIVIISFLLLIALRCPGAYPCTRLVPAVSFVLFLLPFHFLSACFYIYHRQSGNTVFGFCTRSMGCCCSNYPPPSTM